MRKADYELIANVVSETRATFGKQITIEDLIEVLILAFSDDNPRFKPELFRKACKPCEDI